MNVTSDTFPKLFTCFTEISYDNGAVSRDSPEPHEYVLPEEFGEARLRKSEEELQRFTPADLNLLCTGDESEQMALVERHSAHTAHRLLNDFFEVM